MESLISRDIPDYSWETIATDEFTWNKQDYLLVVYYYRAGQLVKLL